MPHPQPDITPDGPRYEGRLLANPEEEVVDQGLRFDLGTLVTRRRALGFFAIGAGSLALAACAPAASSSTATTDAATGTATGGSTTTTTAAGEIPDETAGPYPGDGSNGPDVLEESGIVRQDIRTSTDGSVTAVGIPMTLTLSLIDMANGNIPFENVAVYAWHCDRDGNYSLYSDGVTNIDYLRGVQVADADGNVTFTSIFPACYTGRWPHIHFEVYPSVDDITDSANAIATSQVALPQDVCETVYATSGYESSVSNLAQLSLDTDNVFGDDGGELQLATVTGNTSSGYQVNLAVAVDTTTTPTAGSVGGGGQGGGGGQRP